MSASWYGATNWPKRAISTQKTTIAVAILPTQESSSRRLGGASGNSSKRSMSSLTAAVGSLVVSVIAATYLGFLSLGFDMIEAMSAVRISTTYVPQKIIAQACTKGRSRVCTPSIISLARPG